MRQGDKVKGQQNQQNQQFTTKLTKIRELFSKNIYIIFDRALNTLLVELLIGWVNLSFYSNFEKIKRSLELVLTSFNVRRIKDIGLSQ